MNGYESLNNWQIGKLFESRYDEYRIKSESLGLDDVVTQYAKELQTTLSDDDFTITFIDAYEMAYNEIVIPSLD